jgi:predicted alpha/beta-fold hydrolase
VALEYTSPEFANLSRSEEIEIALSHMQRKFKDHPNVHYVGVGTSMGGNLMMRVAGEQGDKFPLDAMVSINNPFDIWLSINLMRNTPYEKFLAREMRKNIMFRPSTSEQERKIFEQMEKKFGFTFEELTHTESWAEFDSKITLKIYPGHKTVADFYYAASCLSKV